MTTASPHDNKENNEADPAPSSKSRRGWALALLAVCVIAFGVYFFDGQSDSETSTAAQKEQVSRMRRVPVTAVPAKKGDIGVYLSGLGTVTPHHTVVVKTRVDGQLMKVLFREGQMVNSGELLAEIDPRPFEVLLIQAEGQMARDKAQLENARIDLNRFQVLSQQDSIAKQQLDTQRALVHQLEGTVKADQGLIDNARLQLLYSRITAPVSGRVGLRTVDPGNIVHVTDATGLVTITQLQPIAVIFPIAEDSIPPVVDRLRRGKRLQVEAYDRQQMRRLDTGILLTIDNQIDPTTGTVRCKADFPNKGRALFPNQFVNARLLLDVKRGVTIVPAVAIQRSPQGPFVYVVRSDQTVMMRTVKIGVSHEDVVSIDQGVSPGELVVVSGVERLREGSPVEVKSQATGTPQGRSETKPEQEQKP